jgi:hypothetical protein
LLICSQGRQVLFLTVQCAAQSVVMQGVARIKQQCLSESNLGLDRLPLI